MNRRSAVTRLTAGAVALASGLHAATARAQAAQPLPGPILVAYLTRSGNTAVFATTLARRLQADLFRIETAQPYPADYEAHVARATRERDSNAAPELVATVPDFERYGTVILGFPIWGTALPAPIRSFLAAHPIGPRTLIPVVTHGGYGPGSALGTLAELTPQAQRRDPFVLECDQERRQLGQLNSWFASITT